MDWIEFFAADRFASINGIELSQAEAGSAVATMIVTENHLNAAGVAQGGAIFTLADLVMAAAANAHGVASSTLQSDIRFLSPCTLGQKLTATASEVSLRRTVAHYRVEIVNDANQMVAIAEGICFRKQS